MAGRRPLTRSSDLCLDLESLPPRLVPSALFHTPGPVRLEIGTGKGTFLRDWALRSPQDLHLGLELREERAQRTALKCAEAGLHNVRVVHGSMEDLFARLDPRSRLEAIHVNFPDPWPKKRHARRRLMTADRVSLYARHLAPGGALVFVTDSPEYALWTREILVAEPTLRDVFGGIRHHWPCYPVSIHQEKFLAMGRTMHYQKFARVTS